MSLPFHSIASAVQSIYGGQAVLVVDTKPDLFYGGFAIAARHVTSDVLRLFLTEGRGVLAVPIDQSICLRFGLRPYDSNRTDDLAYTITFNLRRDGGETGQSMSERALAIRALIDPRTTAADIQSPGFISPVLTKEVGVLESPNLASATTDLARLAGLEPAGAMIQILDENGDLANLERLFQLAARHRLQIISLAELVEYRRKQATLPARIVESD